jgi:hypothetical protein
MPFFVRIKNSVYAHVMSACKIAGCDKKRKKERKIK